MKIFLDTANLDEIKKIAPWGIISGLTTNQKIFCVEKNCNFKERVHEILQLIDGPVSVEVTSNTVEGMIKEAREYSRWDQEKIVIKVPMTANGDGLRVVNTLKNENIKTNMTVLICTNQVLLAALAGATYASIFFNRSRDSGEDAEKVVRDSVNLIDKCKFKTEVIVGSIRQPLDVMQAAVAGAHIITIPYKVLTQMPYHPKTEETIKEFDLAWQEFLKNQEKS